MTTPGARISGARGRNAVVSLLLLVGAALGGIESCGARSELLPSEEPCSESGSVRACANLCGTGQQICENGFWQACDVPATFRACSNACGGGIAACADGRLGRCDVPEVERPCMNACGAGSERCAEGDWQACEVPVTSRTCTNECGSGSETCDDGEWGACEVPRVAIPCASVCGSGEEICEGGRWRTCNAPQPMPPVLSARIRDFTEDHPDFEIAIAGDQLERGLVESELGPDDKPVYANVRSLTTSGAANFDQWYRDVPGVNLTADLALELQRSPDNPGLFVFEDTSFFPIDGQLLGNERYAHNYHFTLEVSTRFQYLGGEIFRFTGDDDMWVFINRRLAIDLGGTHRSMTETVDLDREAARLGITAGAEYPLHFFFAERHTVQSNFTIETSISEPGSCQ